MVIAIDLDGVVFDTEEYFRTYAHIYDIKLIKNGYFDKKEMNVFARHNWDQETADKFYQQYTAQVMENAPLKPCAKFVLNELKKRGHKLVCITLRGVYRECEIDITEKRVKEENIVFDKIYYSQQNKLEACLNEKVDLIIDDNPNTIEFLANNGIKCFHFRGAGLRKVENENVTEVRNWAEILQFLKDKNLL